MMGFLVLNVPDNLINMAFGIGECAKAFLPGKWGFAKFIGFDPFTAFCFYILNQ